MRMLAKNELNHVSGATNAEIPDIANILKESGNATLKIIEWKPDQSGSLVPVWTPNGSLATDAWEGLIIIGYLGYKHYQTIFAAVVSVIRK